MCRLTDPPIHTSLGMPRARYVSNRAIPAPTDHHHLNDAAGPHDHDLVRYKMASFIDDQWIEGIRAEDFLMKLALALQRYGSPPPRTETLLTALAPRLRVEGCVSGVGVFELGGLS